MAVLKNTKSRELIQEMWEHEKAHLAKFEELLVEYEVRPVPVPGTSWWSTKSESDTFDSDILYHPTDHRFDQQF